MPLQLITNAIASWNCQIVRVRGPDDVSVEFIASTNELEQLKNRERNNKPELWLRQVKQFYSVVSATNTSVTSGNPALQLSSKIARLVALLSDIAFSQCIVFCNDKFAAEALATALSSQGWPAACIMGSQAQSTRLSVMEDFRAYRSRVLVSTDLTARGIDIDTVNFVVRLILRWTLAPAFHERRVVACRSTSTFLETQPRTSTALDAQAASAGRYPSHCPMHADGVLIPCFAFLDLVCGLLSLSTEHGIAVTLLLDHEIEGILLLARVFSMEIQELPMPVPRDVVSYAAADSTVGGADSAEDRADIDIKTAGSGASNREPDFEPPQDHHRETVDKTTKELATASRRLSGSENSSSHLDTSACDDRGETHRTEFVREEVLYEQWVRQL